MIFTECFSWVMPFQDVLSVVCKKADKEALKWKINSSDFLILFIVIDKFLSGFQDTKKYGPGGYL